MDLLQQVEASVVLFVASGFFTIGVLFGLMMSNVVNHSPKEQYNEHIL